MFYIQSYLMNSQKAPNIDSVLWVTVCVKLTYALHVVEVSKVPMVEILPREVEKAFCTRWLNIVCHIEDEASSESDKKVEWYSDCHNNLTDDLRLAEEKASAEQGHHQKADKKLVQANSKM